MKLFNNKNIGKFGIVLLGLSLTLTSCEEYLDVDTDTDNPTEAPLNLLLTGIQVDMNNVSNFNGSAGSVLAVYTHQMSVREEEDQYGARVDNPGVSNEWSYIYSTLTNVESLIKQGEDSGNLVYAGIGQIQKAFLYSVAVDLWGDVPFSEANKLKEGIVSPKFDDQKEIYAAVFDLIEQGKANIASNSGDLKPATDDLIYGGNIAKWIKFANTFKLKLYNQTRLTPDFDQTGFDSLIAEDNFFTSSADDYQFVQFNQLAPSDHRNKFFLESYNSTQFGTYMSPWFYEILKGINPKIHTNSLDPRIPYYFFNQLKPGQLPLDQGDATTGNPRADYWDRATGFFGIRFGSNGPFTDFTFERSATYPGIYPAGGRYDDGQGGDINTFMTSGNPNRPTGIAPQRILTFDEYLFIKAELIWAGKISGEASATLKQAIEANFLKIDEVVRLNQAPQNIPTLSTQEQATNFVTKIIEEFNAASADKKLEVIMTQKWVATFGDPMDQYNDYRRTGFPVLANPNSTEKEYQLNNGDAWPIDDSQTNLSNQYQYSLFWPQNELNSNQNAPAQKSPTTYRIFWNN